MPVKRPQLVNNEIYHIIVRGVDGRDIFNSEKDYYRAIHDLFEFNDTRPASWQYRHYNQYRENRSRDIGKKLGSRDFIINILAFCLMPNHIHLLLKQTQEAGISFFMRKFGAGYAGYFNRKYERKGHLFQGRFRAVHVKSDAQLKTAFVYIHTNPAVLIDKDWKEGGIKNPKEVIKFIENYKWSSYQDYLGKKIFPSVTQREFFEQIMSRDQWRKFVNEWVEYKTMKGWDRSVELE